MSDAAIKPAPKTEAAPLPREALEALLAERYGSGSAARTALGNAVGQKAETVLAQLLSHRSRRAFLDAPLPEGAVGLAIAAGQSASTSSNLQAWSVVEVTDPVLKAALNALSGNQAQIDEAPSLLVWLADLSRLRRASAQEGGSGAALDYTESLLIGIIDAALAAQNALLALEAQGLGGCFIGGIRNDADKVAALLGLPPEVLPVFGMTVGIPDPKRPARIKPRLPAGAVLHRNAYDQTSADAGVVEYEQALLGFQAAEGLPPKPWRQIVAQRIGTPAALKGRERLVSYLRTLGFALK